MEGPRRGGDGSGSAIPISVNGTGAMPLENSEILHANVRFGAFWRRLSNFGGENILSSQYFLLGATLIYSTFILVLLVCR